MKKCFFSFLVFFSVFSIVNAGWAEDILKNMSVEEKVGQLFMIGAVSDPDINLKKIYMMGKYFDPEAIERLVVNNKIGGIVFFGGTVEKQVVMTNRFQKPSAIPLLIGQDSEWGLNMR